MARQAPIVGRILAITTLLVILGAAVVSAYKPGFSRAAIATGGQDILYAHDTHPVSAVSAILGSAATAGGCTPLRAGPGGAAGCGGADLVISLINRAGAKTGQFRFGTPANDVGLGIAWNRADGLLYVLGKSNGQHWLAVFYVSVAGTGTGFFNPRLSERAAGPITLPFPCQFFPPTPNSSTGGSSRKHLSEQRTRREPGSP